MYIANLVWIIFKNYGTNFTRDPETDLEFQMIHMDIPYTEHIWDPQSVKVYRKSGRVSSKILGLSA